MKESKRKENAKIYEKRMKERKTEKKKEKSNRFK